MNWLMKIFRGTPGPTDGSERMFQLMDQFVKSPGEEHFLALREEFMKQPEYDPADVSQLNKLSDLIEQGQLEQAMTSAGDLMKGWFLNPGFHHKLAELAEKLGKKDLREQSEFYAETCLVGICMTGTGKKARPFMVTRVDDEYVVLRKCNAHMVSQTLIEEDGRKLDMITSSSGQEIYFDVTDMHNVCLKRNIPTE